MASLSCHVNFRVGVFKLVKNVAGSPVATLMKPGTSSPEYMSP